ncbi:hypothetical protein Godav_012659 [Gossypium davidsonii]|uniref:Uncharacterized protein n=1 Tax=Gossypium davidsonii TaxID=34287 RepID=A0A7J8RF57_GOSDV|nr:hypothetical protein [Gossypium davidsonii]
MHSVVNTKALLQSPKGETLLRETDATRSHTTIPRTIQWHEINLPDKWKLEGATDPVAPTLIRNTLLSEISQHHDGTVELKFNRPQRMPPRYSFEIGSTNTVFRRLNLEEESNLETQIVDFKTTRASDFDDDDDFSFSSSWQILYHDIIGFEEIWILDGSSFICEKANATSGD